MLERIFDAGTQRRLLATGLTSGWHCLEVGAGAGSIVRWLEQRVGPSGKVVALDTDPRFLRGSGSSTIEILQGDICDTDLPLATFDLARDGTQGGRHRRSDAGGRDCPAWTCD